MLVLSRNTGQSIIIDNNIEVMVLGTQGNQVRIGINAPANTVILRPEAKCKVPQRDINTSQTTTL